MTSSYASFYHEHCVYLPAMLGWFLFSALLSSYNKFVFGENHYHFPCPLLMTSVHFLVQWVFSIVACNLAPDYFGRDRVLNLSWKDWWHTSVPCGVVTAGDVGLSNLALVRITITFYTMIKASTPIFVLAWAYIFGIERITLTLIGVVLIIACGEFLTVIGEVKFDKVGMFLCLGASVLSGARWTLVQLKLRSLEPPLKTTIATMRLLSPSMFFSLISLSLIVEKPWITLAEEDLGQTTKVAGLGMLGAFFAIAMVLCEFYLIMRANAIVLMIGGVLKEMVTIIIGVTCFGDELNRINVSGCFVVFLGVLLYKVSHYIEAQRLKQSLVQPSERGFNMHEADTENENTEVTNILTEDTTEVIQTPRPAFGQYCKVEDGSEDVATIAYTDNASNNSSSRSLHGDGIELRKPSPGSDTSLPTELSSRNLI